MIFMAIYGNGISIGMLGIQKPASAARHLTDFAKAGEDSNPERVIKVNRYFIENSPIK